MGAEKPKGDILPGAPDTPAIKIEREWGFRPTTGGPHYEVCLVNGEMHATGFTLEAFSTPFTVLAGSQRKAGPGAPVV